MSAQGLHPFKGFTTEIADKVFSLSVDGLVSVEGTGGDEGLPADLTPVRPLARVCPDVSRQVGIISEGLLAHRAAVGLVPALVAVAVVVVGVKGQRGLLQARL